MQKPLKDLGTQVGAFYRGVIRQNAPADPDSFGLEIELEGLGGEHWTEFAARLPQVAGWQTVEDGSLRDGVEFVSNGARPYSSLRGDLADLAATFEGVGFTPVFSFRTSLHVHMNAMHLTWRDVLKIYMLYTIFEKHLMDMGGSERQGNVHCLGAALAQQTIHDLREALQADRAPTKVNRYGELQAPLAFGQYLAPVTDRGRRYAAFNFSSLPQHGTIEFRNHRGTADVDTVMAWVDTLRAMRDYATSAVQTPIEMMQRYSTLGEVDFAAEVFGQESPIAVAVSKDRGQTHEGMRLAQELAFARNNWDVKATAKPKAKKSGDAPMPEGDGHDDWQGLVQREIARQQRVQELRNMANRAQPAWAQNINWADFPPGAQNNNVN